METERRTTIEFSSNVWTQQFVKGLQGEWFIGVEDFVNGSSMGTVKYYGPFDSVVRLANVKSEIEESVKSNLTIFKKQVLTDLYVIKTGIK